MEDLINRNPLVAALLSLLIPGLGHLYCGQVKQAILIYLAWIILPFLAYSIGIFNRIESLMAFFLMMVIFGIIVVVDTATTAKSSKTPSHKVYNKILLYILILILYFGQNLVFSITIKKYCPLEAFKIRYSYLGTNSTVSQGDCIMVDKESNLKTDDVILFSSDFDSAGFGVGTILARSGDSIKISSNNITIPEGNILIKSELTLSSYGNNKTLVPVKDIIGKCLYIYWPPKRIRNL